MAGKKRLIIHLGLPRTGTTSIQSFLRSNEAALKSCGIWYPKFDPERYIKITGPQDSLSIKTTIANLNRGVYHLILSMAVRQSPQGAKPKDLQISPAVWNDFLEEFENGNCHTAIISFEGFGATPSQYNLEKLKNSLSKFQITGIVYHRSYDSWVKSLFEHSIRGKGRYKFDVERLMGQGSVRVHPFINRIDSIKKNFLLDEIIVRSFETAAKSDNLLRDFFVSLNLDEAWKSLPHPERARANSAFSPSQTLVLLQLNQWNVADDAFVEVRRAFGRMRNKPQSDDLYTIIPAPSLDKLRAMASAEAESLRTQFGIEPALTKPPPGPLPHRLGRERFCAMIDSISDAISPKTREEVLRRADELES